jgi:hypothetical protein
MTDIYNDIELNKHINKKELYELLIQSYTEKTVVFVMYDMFKYIYPETEEKKKRKEQDLFKMDLVRRYKKCIITDTSYKVCQACHIIPFSECDDKDKYDINNGLLLRADLHILFDRGDLKINPNTLQIELSNEILKDNNMSDYFQLNNKKLNININSIKYLQNIY